MMNEEKRDIQKEISQIAPVFAHIEARYDCIPSDKYFAAMQQHVWKKIFIPAQVHSRHTSLPVWIEYLLSFLQPQYSLVLITIIGVAIASALLHSGKSADMHEPDPIAEYLLEEDITIEEVMSEMTSDDIALFEKNLHLAYTDEIYTIYDYFLDNPDNFLTEEAL